MIADGNNDEVDNDIEVLDSGTIQARQPLPDWNDLSGRKSHVQENFQDYAGARRPSATCFAGVEQELWTFS
jgi:hypothetical protein